MRAPKLCDTVFATVVPHEATVAVLYWARSVHFGLPLVMFDWSCGQLDARTWDTATEILAAAGDRMRARFGNSGAWVEGTGLAQQASAHGLPSRAVPAWLEHPDYWPRLGVAAAGYIRDGHIKLTDEALAKADRQAFGAVAYRGGERGDDPTVPAFLYGITLALDESAATDPKIDQMTAVAGAVARATAAQIVGLL